MKDPVLRRRDMLAAGSALAATAIATPAIAQSTPALKWRLTASWPKSLDTIYEACEIFAKAVSDMTNDKFQIQVFAAGEIVPALSALDAVQNGTVEMCHTASYYSLGKDLGLIFGSSIPFGPNKRIADAWQTHGGGNELLQELFIQFNAYGIPMGNTGVQMGGWFRRELKDETGFKGLKFRIGGYAGKVIAEMGGVPQQLSAGEIYPALEKGVIDAAEWIGPYDDEKLGLSRIAPYYYRWAWWEHNTTVHLFVNLDKWNALPKQYQAIVNAAAQYAGHWLMTKYDTVNPPALKRLIANGAQLRQFSPVIMEASWKAANKVLDANAAQNPLFNRMYKSLKAFSNESYLWWQVAEYPSDNFMIRKAREDK